MYMTDKLDKTMPDYSACDALIKASGCARVPRMFHKN